MSNKNIHMSLNVKNEQDDIETAPMYVEMTRFFSEWLANLEKPHKVQDSFKNLKNCPFAIQKYQKFDEKIRKKIIDLEDDKLIQDILNYCIREKPELMLMVADLLPDLVKFYNNLVINFIKQLTYVKVPLKWGVKEKYNSTNENLWGYKFPDPKLSPSIFDRFKKIPRHSITLCYIPLPGLCTYEKAKTNYVLDTLFPCNPSPFVKLCFSGSSEVFQASQASSKIFESPILQAIVKYKWHAFAWWRFFGFFFFCSIHFGLFTAAISENPRKKQLLILNMMSGTILLVLSIRSAIVHVLIGTGTRFFTIPSTYVEFSISILPITIGFLEYGDITTHSILRFPTIIILWAHFIGSLCIFRSIGIFTIIIMHICRKTLPLLIFLTLIIFTCSHGAIVLFQIIQLDSEEKISRLDQAIKYGWFGFLGDYSFLNPWPSNFWLDISRIIFSFFTSVIILNIMIAIVNNIYGEVYERARTEWTIMRARTIACIELNWLTSSGRQNQDYFPWTIIYEVNTEEVEKWYQNLEADNVPIFQTG